MNKTQKSEQNSNRPPPAGSARWIFPLAAALLAGAAAVGYWWTLQRPADVASSTATVQAANQPAPAAAREPGFAKLKGRWLRPDGGYILEIRSVEAGGKMDATYNNPNPIHVARAEASETGTVTKVFVELRDVNYPGCTYYLTYEAQSDQLAGIYYQSALQQQFEVIFVRTP